jgi:hypothetical protein
LLSCVLFLSFCCAAVAMSVGVIFSVIL